MFIILTYDADKKHDAKIMRICRRFLTHRQYSVFEGLITAAKLDKLKQEISKVVDACTDSVCIYKFESLKFASRDSIGLDTSGDGIM